MGACVCTRVLVCVSVFAWARVYFFSRFIFILCALADTCACVCVFDKMLYRFADEAPTSPPSSFRSVYNEIKTHLPAMYLLAEDERQHEHHISGVGQYRLFLWKNGLIIIENSMLLPTFFELSNVTLSAIFKKQTDDKKLNKKHESK